MLMHQPVLDSAERDPDRLAFRWVDRDRALTHAGAVNAMERMAGALGARPTALVAIAEGASVAPEDLERAIARELAFDLAPLATRLVAELPVTPTGKIAKGALFAREASR